MSMRVDRHQSTETCHIPARTPATWIPDARVHRCFSCNAEFTFWKRKHHCRSCGRIFCASCSNQKILIPSYFCAESGPTEQDNQYQKRVCTKCCEQLTRASRVEWLVRALAVMPVTFQELMSLRLLSQKWNNAVNTLIHVYRGLQYRLPKRRYSRIICQFLWSHYREFVGHIQWQLHTFAALKQAGMLRKRLPMMIATTSIKCSCRQLMCSRTCRPAMSVDDVLKVASSMTLSEYAIQTWVIVSWHHMQKIVHIKMMPWWVYIAQRFKRLFTEGLLPMCKKHLQLAFALYFECDLQKSKRNWKLMRAVQQRLRQTLSKSHVRALDASIAFVNLLITLQTKSSEHTWAARITEFFMAHKSAPLPWKPNTCIVQIDHMSMYRLKTTSKPIVFTCWTDKQKSLQFILKGQDVRSDRLAMTIGYWINCLTRAHVHIYNVFPLSQCVGIVSKIPQTTTLYDVKYRKNISLLNYILQHNLQVPHGKLRTRIVGSATGACLLAFTMGLGDRHLENILVTKSGMFIHVDFGYILGDDPKHAYTHMRLTEDMIDAMGGKHSETFRTFHRFAQESYAAMRNHTSFWYHLLSAEYFIFHDASRHWRRIRNHILNRFVPGEWNDEASLQIDTVVDNAARSSWSQQLADLSHSASNRIGEMFHMEL